MNNKRAKLKAIVIAFALVFSGFAALMLVPQSVAAADPTVTTAEATDIGTTTATLNMEFDMGTYDNVTAFFMYNVTGEVLDQRTGEHEYGAGNTTHMWDLTDLSIDTGYTFKAVVEFWNTTDAAHYTEETAEDTFTTEVATVTTLAATDVGATVATLNMEFDMGAQENVTVYFNYTADAWATYMHTDEVMYEDAANDTAHEDTLTGLAPNTTYDFKAVLVYNDTGEVVVVGDEVSFTTEVATVTTVDATPVYPKSAKLNMEFEMGDLDEVYVYFLYNLTGETVEIMAGNVTYGAGNTTHGYTLTGLAPNTTYDFKAVLVYNDTAEVTIEGDVHNFTTPLISVMTKDATAITATTATLNMEFHMGDFAEVTVWFDDGTDMITGSNITYGAGNTTHSFVLEELIPNTVNEYKAVLEYDNETIEGDLVEYITYCDVAIDGPATILAHEDATFTAVITGTVVNYTWTADNVEVGEDANNLTLNWTSIGPRTIGLTILDDKGLEASATFVVDVQVEVTITVDDGNATIEGADVSLRGDLGFSDANTTEADGTVVFTVWSVTGGVHEDDVEDMAFEVTASHADYIPKTEEFVGLEHTISLDAASEWTVVIGPVVDKDGIAVPDAEVALHWDDGNNTGTTDMQGWVEFTFDFNPYHLDFTAVITHVDYRTKTVTFTGSVSGQIELSDEPYEFVIGPVVDEVTDEPISNAAVIVTVGEWSEMSVTDEDGNAYFYVLAFDPDDVATYHVEVSHADYVTKTVENYELGDIITLETPVIEYTVSVGPLKDRAGKFINDATVTISWNPELTETSGVNGMYTFVVDFDPSETDFEYTISHPDLDEDITGTFTGANSGSMDLEVGEEPSEPATGMSMALIGGLAVLVLIIIVVVVMMMKKKPAEEVGEEEFLEEEEPMFEEEEDLFEEEEEEPLFEEEEDLFEEEEEEPLFEEEEELFEEEEENLFDEEEL